MYVHIDLFMCRYGYMYILYSRYGVDMMLFYIVPHLKLVISHWPSCAGVGGINKGSTGGINCPCWREFSLIYIIFVESLYIYIYIHVQCILYINIYDCIYMRNTIHIYDILT